MCVRDFHPSTEAGRHPLHKYLIQVHTPLVHGIIINSRFFLLSRVTRVFPIQCRQMI
ncbi:Uncharacterized protein APZ42_023107 [Daphnia magna]|uniref:Uncharacterized protein n=1 Tax=Daphnia magna TaxID=35525 RepID=A0A164V6Q5_9CRUS|nr:Uncharacterized protein APZ42_023107 [Daphnia magna]